MSETPVVEALDEAKLVRSAVIGGIQYAAVWHGGITVNVYHMETSYNDAWQETHVFTLQDDEGRAVSREEISDAIEQEFEHIASRGAVEVRYGGDGL